MTDLEIAALAATHKAPLSEDKIPDKNQAHHCFSCNAPIEGLFCKACGQKNDNFRRSIFSLIKEFIGSVTGLESRIWQTWAALLFKPGKVARQFADGARTKWSSPVRTFLAMSIILFGYMGFTGTQLLSIDLNANLAGGIDKPLEDVTPEDIKLTGGIKFFDTQKTIEARNAIRNYDLLKLKMGDSGFKLDLDLGDEDDLTVTPKDTNNTNPETDQSETPQQENLEPDTPNTANTGEVVFPNMVFNNNEVNPDDLREKFLDILKDPHAINDVFYEWLPRIMFVMMPFSMLIGAMFIRGRGNALLYDHLVHAAYIHAVLYFIIFVAILCSIVLPDIPYPIIIFLMMLIYLPISLKTMFKRGWFKTIWTAYGVGFIYLLTMIFVMFGLLGKGFADMFL